MIREIAAGAPSHVRSGGGLFLEVGSDQGERVRQLLERDGSWNHVRIEPDLAGRSRFVIALV